MKNPLLPLSFAALAGAAAAQSPAPPAPATLQDYVEIQQLYAAYAHALDRGDGERFASLFTADGEFTGGRGPGRGAEIRTPIKGTEALKAMGGRGGSRHFTTNLVVRPTSATTAKGSAYLLLYNVRVVPPVFVETAIYDDTLEKTPQGWKFKARVVWRDDDDISPFKPPAARTAK